MSDNILTASSINAMFEKSGKPMQDPSSNKVIDLSIEEDAEHQHNEQKQEGKPSKK